MGLMPSFPFIYEPVCFVEESFLDLNGNWTTEFIHYQTVNIPNDKEVYENAFRHPRDWEENACDLYRKILPERQRIQNARLKFHDCSVQEMIRKWPQTTLDTLLDLRSFFLSFDVNGDCLIDFKEFCMVLDELGDRTPLCSRKSFFKQKDSDKSGALDFEEFLELFSRFMEVPSTSITNNKKLTLLKSHGLLSEDSNSDLHTFSDISDPRQDVNVTYSKLEAQTTIDLEKLCEKARDAARILRQLNVKQQIIHGLF
ncbi:unnamed protein product [Dimorphilus gyrociliatus]|uniref:EF-hand domain-containing protein n=1 Tax=Dimorphilus gyrociliatus TaxID=2664684 RepID=A0A7I8V6A1_9ANNE|nr:unnamed protein product [Dimorphilus gyrociliatus]